MIDIEHITKYENIEYNFLSLVITNLLLLNF